MKKFSDLKAWTKPLYKIETCRIIVVGYFFLQMLLMSCSVKKLQGQSNNQVVVKSTSAMKSLKDSDNDGISDDQEIANGTNPLIANIPKLTVYSVGEISVGGIFKSEAETSPKSDFTNLYHVQKTNDGSLEYKGYLKALRKKVIVNQYNFLRNVQSDKSDVITNEDLRSELLSTWSDAEFYLYLNQVNNFESIAENDSGKFKARINLKISDVKNVTQISNIQYKSFFYDTQKLEESEIENHYLLKGNGIKEKFNLLGPNTYNPQQEYNLIANELKVRDVLEKTKNRNEIGIRFTDYDYTTSGVELRYSEVIGHVTENDAKVVFSNGLTTEVFFVAPNQTLKSVLNQLGKKVVENSDGGIYSIDGLETTLIYPFDPDHFGLEDLKKGIWSIFGGSSTLEERLEPKNTYVISYLSAQDILNSFKNKVKIFTGDLKEELVLNNIFPGDELLVDVKEVKVTSYKEEISTTLDYINYPSCEYFAPKGPNSSCGRAQSCTVLTSRPTTFEQAIPKKINDIQINFKAVDEFGNTVPVESFRYQNKFVLKFKASPVKLSNNLKVSVENDLEKAVSIRSGRIGGTCMNRADNYSVVNYKNQYVYKSNLTLTGVNKF